MISSLLTFTILTTLLINITTSAPSAYREVPTAASNTDGVSSNGVSSSPSHATASNIEVPSSDADNVEFYTTSSDIDVNPGFGTTVAPLVCPSKHWYPYHGRCYWISPCVAPWHSIAGLCDAAASGSKPVSVHGEDEHDFIRQLTRGVGDAWIGLRR